MEGYTTESEQLEALRKWWDKNAKWIIAGLVMAAVVIGGWRLWGFWQAKRAAEAATLYSAVVEAEQKSDNAAVSAAAQKVIHAYPDTAYGALAGLARAKAEFAQHHLSDAAAALKAVIANSPDRSLAAVARLRLARVQLQMGDADAALATLRGHGQGAFGAAAESVRGDALLQLGRSHEARAAYAKALAAAKAGSGLHRLLQLRLASLPATAGAAAPASTPAAAATTPAAAATGGAR